MKTVICFYIDIYVYKLLKNGGNGMVICTTFIPFIYFCIIFVSSIQFHILLLYVVIIVYRIYMLLRKMYVFILYLILLYLVD